MILSSIVKLIFFKVSLIKKKKKYPATAIGRRLEPLDDRTDPESD
jgi:hypothetical protein